MGKSRPLRALLGAGRRGGRPRPTPARPQERIQKLSQRVQEKKTVSSVGMTKHTSLQRQLQLQDNEEVRAEAEKQRTFQQNTLWKLLMTKGTRATPGPCCQSASLASLTRNRGLWRS